MKAKKVIGLMSVSACLVLSSLSFSANAGVSIVEGKAKVYSVIDGDTYNLNAFSKESYNQLKSFARSKDDYKYFYDKYNSFRVRLANVDTEESKHVNAKRNTAKGQETSDYVKSFLTGKTVDYSCWKMGKFNRVICSVTYQGRDLGIKLIQEGYSDYLTKFGKHPYMHNEYKIAER